MKRLVAVLVVLLGADAARAGADLAPPSCTIKGKVRLDTSIHSQAHKGVELAHLWRSDWLVELDELPKDSATGRARMRARRESPGLRVDAYVAASDFDFYPQKDLPIVVGHVSISSRTSLRLFHPDAATLDAEPRYPTFHKTRAPLACGDLALVPPKYLPKPTPAIVPREMLLGSTSVPLYDAANGKVVFTLVPINKEPVYLDAFETSLGFEHVRFDGEVKIDGWVRSSDLRPPPEGGSIGLGGLGLGGTGGGSGSSATKWIAKVDTEVRLGTEATAPVVGVLEKGAKVWRSEAGTGWSRVTLVDDSATAPSGKSFHVRTSDLEHE